MLNLVTQLPDYKETQATWRDHIQVSCWQPTQIPVDSLHQPAIMWMRRTSRDTNQTMVRLQPHKRPWKRTTSKAIILQLYIYIFLLPPPKKREKINCLAEPNQIPNLKNNVKNDCCYFMPLNMVGVLYNIRQPDARAENYPQLASDHHGWDAKLFVLLLDPPLPPPRSRISEYSPHHLILTSQDH